MASHLAITPEVSEVAEMSGAEFETYDNDAYTQENAVKPATDEELKLEHIIELKTPSIEKSEPSSPTLIPTLKNMQDEMDALHLHDAGIAQQQFQSAKQGKGKKAKKSKMVKVDAGILGFSVTASKDRINVGDIDTV